MAAAEEDFGLSSSDEADFLELATSFDGKGTKRKAPEDGLPQPKRLKFPSAQNALVMRFGFKSFQMRQEEAIATILSGKSAVVVFPTGGGKSLCYQIPALVFSEEDEKSAGGARHPGVTLVVSPLIALMKDQVDALVRRGIKAASFDSSKSREEYLQTCEMLKNGELKLLYCAPERLNNEGFIEQMKYVTGGIRLLAVDEAHCISEWGHSFRPDYLKIARFAEEINAERVLCLTATATPQVATDICKAFKIDETEGLFRTSTYRSNLRLLAESGKTKKDLFPRLCKFLKENPGATIIYVTLQKQTGELAAMLKQKGFKSKSFHAGLPTDQKTEIQNEFMRRGDLIIVATIAFGMGIDKASIRNVIHFSIPSSLESYSQEIGRAGRDGKISKCMFYLCGEDLHLREMFARGDLCSIDSVRSLLTEIFNPTNASLPVGGEMRFSHYTQEREHDVRSTTLKNIYTQLELTHKLIRAVTPVYTKYSFVGGAAYLSALQSDSSIAASAILKYAKKAIKFYNLDVEQAAAGARIDRSLIIRKLNDLNENGTLELKPAGVMNVYRIESPLPRTGPQIEKLVTSIYSLMVQRETEALSRAEAMLTLITSKSCYSHSLAQHFGDSLPDGEEECGHCTWCLTHNTIELEIPPPVEFNNLAFNRILQVVEERDDPRLLAKIAFGISTPRCTVLKLGKSPVFGSMDDHDFMTLLRTFEKVCKEDE